VVCRLRFLVGGSGTELRTLRQSLARLLLRFFKAHDRERDLLQWVVSEEVTKAANPDTIFRYHLFFCSLIF
jgi:hypothetical protein